VKYNATQDPERSGEEGLTCVIEEARVSHAVVVQCFENLEVLQLPMIIMSVRRPVELINNSQVDAMPCLRSKIYETISLSRYWDYKQPKHSSKHY